jgi:hypothetical protein
MKITEENKSNLYEHFFNTVRMWLNVNSTYNQYENLIMYYSLDQDGFRKRYAANQKLLNDRNWITIYYNQNTFYYLKNKLQLTDKSQLHIEHGRLVNGSYVKDTLYKDTIKFIKITFEEFFQKNKVKYVNNINELNNKCKQLF